MATITYRDALRLALIEEMDRDTLVMLMGEDIGRYQGTFRVTQGLLEKYGSERVMDTPITEPGFTGIAIGAAMVGVRPVVEMMTMSFSILAFDQIFNHAAKVHYMTNGQLKVPMVIRGPSGAANQLSAQHSQSVDAWYAHVPGLKVVAPFTPQDAKGMLKSAIRDDNPVIFLEHPTLYGAKGDVSEDTEFVTPFGKAHVLKEGSDITLLAYSKMVQTCLDTAENLHQQGISAEVIDIRSLLPLDMETISSSVRKTNRAVVVYEGWRNGGFGAEIAARISEECFDYLDGPVVRVAGLNVPMPYARNLELECMPKPENILESIKKIL